MKLYSLRQLSSMRRPPASSPLKLTFQSVQDGRDENQYEAISFNGGPWWLASNLRYAPEGMEGVWPCSEDPETVAEAGHYYIFQAAGQAAAGFGGGWRLPSDEDWRRLLETLGGVFR